MAAPPSLGKSENVDPSLIISFIIPNTSPKDLPDPSLGKPAGLSQPLGQAECYEILPPAKSLLFLLDKVLEWK